MKITKRRAIVAGVVLAVASAVALVPVTLIIESKLIEALKAQGFQDIKLKVSHLGLRGVALENVSIGEETPLELKNVSVNYSFSDLRSKKISGLTIDGLTLTGYRDGDAFKVRGLESLMNTKSDGTASIPVTRDALSIIPLTSLAVKNSNFLLETSALNIKLPLEITWQMQPNPVLHYEAPTLNIKASDIMLSSGKVTVDAGLNEKDVRWDGTWTIDAIVITGAPTELPTMNAKGTLTAEANRVLLKGKIANAENNYHASFELTYDLAGKEKSVLAVSNLRMPWNGGVVGLDSAKLPLGGKRSTNFTLAVERVSIEALMKSLTGARATGTGVVSGTIPVTIGADGKIQFHEGNLRAEEPGVISISPDTIPGDNAQVTLVRDVLKNLHYTMLSIVVNSGVDNRISVLMAVEGKNPDVSGGRPVRLNVHLDGDVLDLIQQNVMAITDPTQLLEKDKNETRQ